MPEMRPGWSRASQQTLLVVVVMVVLLITSLINTIVLYRLSRLPTDTEVEMMESLPPPPDLTSLPSDSPGWLDLVTRQAELHAVRTRYLRQQMVAASQHIAAAEAAMANIRQTLETWRPYHWLEEGEHCDSNTHNCDQTGDQMSKTEF